MIKNRTEFYPSNIIKFIPSIEYRSSKKEKKKEFKKKIELEMRSNSNEFYNFLKKNLEKNEITKEIYLSKHISKDKKFNPNLLITKIDNCEKMLLKKNKLLSKLSKENALFLKNYRKIKDSQAKNGKIESQFKYLNDVAKTYIEKKYDIDKLGINNNENIFKYSILNDKNFGNDANYTALRIIKEMDNSEFLKEQKMIFDFQDELLKEKINNKIKHPAEVLIKHNVKEEDDYGIDNISFIKRKKDNSDINNLLEENKVKNKEINKEENNEEDKEENKEENVKVVQNINKKRPSFLYLQIKSDIKQMQKNILNLDRMKSDYKSESLIKFQKNFKPKLSLIMNSTEGKIISEEQDITDNEKKEEKEKPIIIYNNTEINREKNKNIKPILILNGQKRRTNNKITFIKNNVKKFSVQNKLPNINKSFFDIHNKFSHKRFNKTQTTNYSPNKNFPQTHSHQETLQKNRNSKSFIINHGNQLHNNYKNKANNNIMRKRKKSIEIPISSLINEKIYKTPMNKNELKQSLEKFKKKRETIYDSFLNNDKESNLLGFTKNLQKIIEEKNFGKVYKKNKYLKKNNFSYLMANYDLFNDDDDYNDEGINIQKVDERIKNIPYDSADYLLENHILNKNQILG